MISLARVVLACCLLRTASAFAASCTEGTCLRGQVCESYTNCRVPPRRAPKTWHPFLLVLCARHAYAHRRHHGTLPGRMDTSDLKGGGAGFICQHPGSGGQPDAPCRLLNTTDGTWTDLECADDEVCEQRIQGWICVGTCVCADRPAIVPHASLTPVHHRAVTIYKELGHGSYTNYSYIVV